MSGLQKFMFVSLAVIVIGVLMFFAFTIFLVALAAAPIIYLYSKFRKKPTTPIREDIKPENGDVIDADYEVVNKESVDEKN